MALQAPNQNMRDQVSQEFPIIIVGGNSLITPYLLNHLSALNLKADVISRHNIAVLEGFNLIQIDLSQARNWIAPENAIIVSLLPLWILAQFLPRFIGVKRIIALGSTSRYTKVGSTDTKERSTAAHLELAEDILENWCVRSNVQRILLRSTMIYDGINDHNIKRMAQFIRRFRFIPLASPATGLRQPIHADDVAKAITNCIVNETIENRSFNIVGGETLTYKTMVERVFMSLKLKQRIVMLPTGWLQQAFLWASKIGLVKESAFGSSIFQRMNQDLIFDVKEDLKALNYQPRNFYPEFPNL